MITTVLCAVKRYGFLGDASGQRMRLEFWGSIVVGRHYGHIYISVLIYIRGR